MTNGPLIFGSDRQAFQNVKVWVRELQWIYAATRLVCTNRLSYGILQLLQVVQIVEVVLKPPSTGGRLADCRERNEDIGDGRGLKVSTDKGLGYRWGLKTQGVNQAELGAKTWTCKGAILLKQ